MAGNNAIQFLRVRGSDVEETDPLDGQIAIDLGNYTYIGNKNQWDLITHWDRSIDVSTKTAENGAANYLKDCQDREVEISPFIQPIHIFGGADLSVINSSLGLKQFYIHFCYIDLKEFDPQIPAIFTSACLNSEDYILNVIRIDVAYSDPRAYGTENGPILAIIPINFIDRDHPSYLFCYTLSPYSGFNVTGNMEISITYFSGGNV